MKWIRLRWFCFIYNYCPSHRTQRGDYGMCWECHAAQCKRSRMVFEKRAKALGISIAKP